MNRPGHTRCEIQGFGNAVDQGISNVRFLDATIRGEKPQVLGFRRAIPGQNFSIRNILRDVLSDRGR